MALSTMSAARVKVSPVVASLPLASSAVAAKRTPVTAPFSHSTSCGAAQWRMVTPFVCAHCCSTTEADMAPEVTANLIAASSRDAIRARVMTGKPARQLRTKWTEAWERPDAPEPLPMPLQGLLYGEAAARFSRVHAKDFAGSPVGQIVGSLDRVRPARDVVLERFGFRDLAGEASERQRARAVMKVLQLNNRLKDAIAWVEEQERMPPRERRGRRGRWGFGGEAERDEWPEEKRELKSAG